MEQSRFSGLTLSTRVLALFCALISYTLISNSDFSHANVN